MEIGYARVSTTKQDLQRQIHALEQVGIDAARILVDKKSGTTVERPGLRAALGDARAGDVLVVHTLDRLGRTVRDTLNLIHDLAERGVGVKNLADPIKVDPSDPMAQLLVVVLVLFAQMERTCTVEGATIAQIVEKTGIARTSLYRHMPPRPAEAVTADGSAATAADPER